MKLVDSIPPDCGNLKRRRPTVGTEETDRCSDDELSEVVVMALSADSDENDSSYVAEEVLRETLQLQTLQLQLLDEPTLASTLPQQLNLDDVSVLSMEKLLLTNRGASSSRHLMALLEENQRTLQALLAGASSDDDIKQSSPLTCSTAATATTEDSQKGAHHFELQYSLPGVAAMLLYCMAHASTYELASNLAYQAVDGTRTAGFQWCLYTAMLIVGCLLARASGLVWNFTGPLAYNRVKFIYHNRVRLGAVDARWLHWLNEQGDDVLGMTYMVAYYLCYIAIIFFVSQLAVYCDQREDLLKNLPSTLYQQELQEMMQSDPIGMDVATYLCPAQDQSPEALFGIAADKSVVWDPLACQDDDNDLEIFGPEDDKFFYQTLSKNSYDHFFGSEYEAAMFDSFHQILFYGTIAATAIVTMKAGFGFSFGSGW